MLCNQTSELPNVVCKNYNSYFSNKFMDKDKEIITIKENSGIRYGGAPL